MKIIRKIFSIVLVVCLITVAGNSVVSASESKNISPLDIVNVINELGSSKKPGIKLKASKSAITVKWSGVKKSKIKGAQIKMANNKAMKGAKTYKLSKSKAKKMSYSFKVGDQIVTNSKYYFKVRIKNGSKWTSWSSVKSSKVILKSKMTNENKSEDEKDTSEIEETTKNTMEDKQIVPHNIDITQYRCQHDLGENVTSKIWVLDNEVYDVHTYTNDPNKLFKIYYLSGNTTKEKLSDMQRHLFYFSIDDGKEVVTRKWEYRKDRAFNSLFCVYLTLGTNDSIFLPSDKIVYDRLDIGMMYNNVPNTTGTNTTTLYYKDGIKLGSVITIRDEEYNKMNQP